MSPSTLFLTVGTVLSAISGTSATLYSIGDSYAGETFLDGFDFFTAADPTHGFVRYQSRAVGESTGLVDMIGEATYLGVDYVNPEVVTNNGDGRPSIRIETTKSYTKGLFIVDIEHMPGGICGTWPAFWSLGSGEWPKHGEVDIIEGVNMQTVNKAILHTDTMCSVDGLGQTGTQGLTNCALDSSSGYSGCDVTAPNTNTYGTGFNAVGGGVYIMEWTDEDIKIWFFTRGEIPDSVAGNTPDTTEFGTPLANFKGDCDIPTRFQEHRFIFDTTFCGDWAGNTYASSGCPMYSGLDGMASCKKFVGENPSAFKNAYWQINSFKTFDVKPADTSSSSSSMYSTSSSSTYSTSSSSVSSTSSSSVSGTSSSSVSSTSSSVSSTSSGSSSTVSSTSTTGVYVSSSSHAPYGYNSTAPYGTGYTSTSCTTSTASSSATPYGGSSTSTPCTSSTSITGASYPSSSPAPYGSSSAMPYGSSSTSKPCTSSTSSTGAGYLPSSSAAPYGSNSSVEYPIYSSSAYPVKYGASSSKTPCASSSTSAVKYPVYSSSSAVEYPVYSSSAYPVKYNVSSSKTPCASSSSSAVKYPVYSSSSEVKYPAYSSVPIAYPVYPTTTEAPHYPTNNAHHHATKVTKTYTTTYVDVCSTGYTTKSTTVTVTYTPSRHTHAAHGAYPPPGFTTTEKYCAHGCGAYPTTVTVTIPVTVYHTLQHSAKYVPSSYPTGVSPNKSAAPYATGAYTAKPAGTVHTKVITLSVVPVPATQYYSAPAAAAYTPAGHNYKTNGTASVHLSYGTATGTRKPAASTVSSYPVPQFTGAASSVKAGVAMGLVGAVVALFI
ncbi:glycoside hydrolase family 16 protein [Amniculicola lignicola CBS 123094]|uniref:endo-1,3(4)-beta-glucanase n=1 Tax=Amniculicola lignicola CBS 123094 TaxID=1392246 RepID=A0A6A5WBN6_9PLEO|nr:glycoside hydrolase family 16 protein [Amniculicola lignicola CBS 123094]